MRVLTGSKTTTKESLADELAHADALPVPVSYLRDWATRAAVVAAGGQDPGYTRIPRKKSKGRGNAQNQPATAGNAEAGPRARADVEEVGDDAKHDESEVKADDGATSSAAANALRTQPSFDPTMLGMMEVFMQGVMQRYDAGRAHESNAKNAEDTKTPEEKVLARVRTAVKKRKAIDVCVLGDAHKRRLEQRSSGFTQTKTKLSWADGVFKEDDGTEVPESDAYNPVEVRQGVARWIAECSKSDSYEKNEVADLIEWYVRVYALRVPTEVESERSRAAFIKAFMVKHQGKRGWTELLDADFMLANKYLRSRMGLTGAAAGGTQPQKGSKKSSGHAQGVAAAGRNKWICKAYYQKDYEGGRCTFKGCGHLHTCANCGGGHVASACPKPWDAAKVREAVEATGQKFFPTAFTRAKPQ